MPDKFNFNHLGDRRLCIDCPAGGFAWEWPEQKRKDHHDAHRLNRRQERQEASETQRVLSRREMAEQVDALLAKRGGS